MVSLNRLWKENYFKTYFETNKRLEKIPKAKKTFSSFMTKKTQKHSFYLLPQLRKLKISNSGLNKKSSAFLATAKNS